MLILLNPFQLYGNSSLVPQYCEKIAIQFECKWQDTFFIFNSEGWWIDWSNLKFAPEYVAVDLAVKFVNLFHKVGA